MGTRAIGGGTTSQPADGYSAAPVEAEAAETAEAHDPHRWALQVASGVNQKFVGRILRPIRGCGRLSWSR
jgi:hypothetical protein